MLEPVGTSSDWYYRTYINSQIFNNHVAMASFYEPKGDETAEDLLDMEALAVTAFETAMPGAVVTAIDGDIFAEMAGGIHAIVHEIPAESGGEWEPPAEYCGDWEVNGDEECDGPFNELIYCEEFELGHGEYAFCSYHCTFDTSGCAGEDCGNGVLDDGEECDPCIAQQEACSDYGLGSGQVGCNLNCTLNMLNCGDATACEGVAALNPDVLCCPDPPPEDCDVSSWEWSSESSAFGCCDSYVKNHTFCDGDTLVTINCGIELCGYDDEEGALACVDETLDPPADPNPDIDCPEVDQDAGPDAGGGGDGDDDGGCGCSSAGGYELDNLLGLVIYALD
jgi:hypothetical protein